MLEQAAVETDGEWITEEVFMSVLSNSAGGRVELGEPDPSGQVNSKASNRFRNKDFEAYIHPAQAAWPSLADIERQHVLRTLEHTFYNKSATARLLGVSRQALLRKMDRLGISG